MDVLNYPIKKLAREFESIEISGFNTRNNLEDERTIVDVEMADKPKNVVYLDDLEKELEEIEKYDEVSDEVRRLFCGNSIQNNSSLVLWKPNPFINHSQPLDNNDEIIMMEATTNN